MARYRSKPRVIDAEQFTDADNPPKGVDFDETACIQPAFFVTTIQGERVRVQPGEFIVTESDGVHYYPIAADEFAKLYDQCPWLE